MTRASIVGWNEHRFQPQAGPFATLLSVSALSPRQSQYIRRETIPPLMKTSSRLIRTEK